MEEKNIKNESIKDNKLFTPLVSEDILKENRKEKPDQHEKSKDHLKHAENAYLELAQTYKWKTIECTKESQIKTISDIHQELLDYILKELEK